MAKTKKIYSSLSLDDSIYDNPGLLQSDAMKRIEEEQEVSSKETVVPDPEPVNTAPADEIVSELVPAVVTYSAAPAVTEQPVKRLSNKEVGFKVADIFSKDHLHEKDFTSAILHNDVLEDLHELARIRDGEGKRYPVKYLASNIIRNYLHEHREELSGIKSQFKNRRS